MLETPVYEMPYLFQIFGLWPPGLLDAGTHADGCTL